MGERRICQRCVLPESPPQITLDEKGVCSVCAAHQQASADDVRMLESDFTKILAQHKGKGEFDALVMCSGGKDSTAALYYMVKRYKARVLAFMFDHGFETGDAVENVHRAVEKLGCDFLFYRSTFMHDAFARMLKSGSRAVICHLCSMWYMDLTFRTAARYEIPLIIAGWTKGQSTKQPVMTKCACAVDAPEYARMAVDTKQFLEQELRKDARYADFPDSMDEVLKRAKKRHKSLVLSPHWFLPYESGEYVKLIQDELGWRYPRESYPGKSTNCALNFISAHNSLRYHGFTHYHIEMSKLIRDGLMDRSEALELLRVNWDDALLSRVAEPLGVRFEQGEVVPLGVPAKTK